MKAVETCPHEWTANYLFNDHGLAPFFACDSVIKSGGGSNTGAFVLDGEQWTARLSYQDSSIVYPGETTPQGTEWNLQPADTTPETLRREYRLKVERHDDEDPVGEQDFSVHLSPRWPGMKGRKNDGTTTEIPVPDQFGEGVNCKVQGSNIEFERYADLLALAFDSVGVSAHYFEKPHQSSNIQDAERYVRLHKDESGPVHARDGPIAELSHLLESDRQGYRKVVQNDDDEKNRILPGYYHTVTLGPRRITEAWPSHELPKEIKHYYAREALTKSKDHPLRHPKLGASYQVSRWDDTLSLSQLDEMNDELEEAVHSVLIESGIDVAPVQGTGPYFEDAYFTVEVREIGTEPMNLDVSHIRSNQESVVIRHVADGLNPVQWESLETLVSDGGQVAPKDIAEEHERHVGSVRRALREMEDLVERKYAEVGLKSDFVADMVHDAVQEARQSARRAVETTAKAVEAAERGVSQTMAEWIAWCERYGVDIRNRADALEIDLGDLDPEADASPSFYIRQGLQAWKDAEQDPQRYRTATVRVNGMTTRAFTFL